MAQFGSNRKRKGIKVSLVCILMSVVGVCISSLVLFTRYQPATRPKDLSQAPPPRTLKEREMKDYMKTGRKPQHVDAAFSDRNTRNNPPENKKKKIPFVEKGLEEYRNHHDFVPPKILPPNNKPGKDKKTHFYKDQAERHRSEEDLPDNEQVHDPNSREEDESHEDAHPAAAAAVDQKQPMTKKTIRLVVNKQSPHKKQAIQDDHTIVDVVKRRKELVMEDPHQRDKSKSTDEPQDNAAEEEHHYVSSEEEEADAEEYGMDSGDAQAMDPDRDADPPSSFKGPVDPRYEWQRTHHWKNAGKNNHHHQPKPILPNGQPLPKFENPIQFIDYKQLSKQDTFSASWMQRREEFLEMPLEKIMICEDAAWEAWDSRPEQLRMTLDYMDFSVEHLSKWWKFMSFYNTPIAYNALIQSMVNYIHRGHLFPTPPLDQLMMPNTLTMIAFQPYLHKKEQQLHYNLTVTALATTIESIRRAEIGRVVVVGMVDNGYDIAQHAFRYLADQVPGVQHQVDQNGIVTKIGHLEVGYARGSMTYAKSKHLAKNIPRAVLYGTRDALLLGDKPVSERTADETAYITEWLGDQHSPSFWKYFYLTEPDTLLNARKSAIPQLKAQMDQGYVLAPHRLQPIPHESDLKGLQNRFRYLNEDNGWDKVWEIDETKDVCCDEHKGPDTKPGRDNFPNCGTWWYMCGFKKDYKDKSLGDVHERLRPYSLIKLKGGTGLTLLAGNLFGRRCFPAKDTVCKPPQ